MRLQSTTAQSIDKAVSNQNSLTIDIISISILLLITQLHLSRHGLSAPLHLRQSRQLSDIVTLLKRPLDKRVAVAVVRVDNRLAARAAIRVRLATDKHILKSRQVAADLVRHKAQCVVGRVALV